MSNYVNLENAKALKELGFDVPVTGYYDGVRDVLMYSIREKTNGHFHGLISAPDFLTAADWIYKITDGSIALNLFAGMSSVWKGAERIVFKEASDHRNAAIAYAIQQIKARKNADKRTN